MDYSKRHAVALKKLLPVCNDLTGQRQRERASAGVAGVVRSGRLDFSREKIKARFLSEPGLSLQIPGWLHCSFMARGARLKVGRSVSIAVSKVCLHHRAPQEQVLLGNSLVWATEIKVRAERRTGELLKDMPKNTGAKGIGKSAVSKVNHTATLKDLKITKKESATWHQLAKIPEPEFERRLAKASEHVETLQSPS